MKITSEGEFSIALGHSCSRGPSLGPGPRKVFSKYELIKLGTSCHDDLPQGQGQDWEWTLEF